jgi:ankyrin repeat protein
MNLADFQEKEAERGIQMQIRGYGEHRMAEFKTIAKVSQEEADELGKKLINKILSAPVSGMLEIRNLILAGANLEYRYYEQEKLNVGFTPLLFCCRIGLPQIFSMLVRAGADINCVSDYGSNCVAWAAREGHDTILSDLIFLGGDINLPCKDGDTPLHSATRHNKVASVKTMITAGAILNPVNQKGETPLKIARAKGYEDIANLFADAMISELPALPVVTNNDLTRELINARERFMKL